MCPTFPDYCQPKKGCLRPVMRENPAYRLLFVCLRIDDRLDFAGHSPADFQRFAEHCRSVVPADDRFDHYSAFALWLADCRELRLCGLRHRRSMFYFDIMVLP